MQLIYLSELTVPDADQAIWRKIWPRILVASQSCNHGTLLQERKWCHICERRAGQQAQHPGENLQRYGLDDTWGQVMKDDVGLLIGEDRDCWLGSYGDCWLGKNEDCWLGIKGECWLGRNEDSWLGSYGDCWLGSSGKCLLESCWDCLLGSNSMATDITTEISDSPFNSGTAANYQSTGCLWLSADRTITAHAFTWRNVQG